MVTKTPLPKITLPPLEEPESVIKDPILPPLDDLLDEDDLLDTSEGRMSLPSDLVAASSINYDDERWYLVFETWMRSRFFFTDPQHPEISRSLLRWYEPEGEWYLYDTTIGCYQKVSEIVFNRMLFQWADAGGYKTTQGMAAHAATRFRTLPTVATSEPWDNDLEWENLTNGVLNKKTLLLQPHHPIFHSKRVIPRRWPLQPNHLELQLVNTIFNTICNTPENGDRLRKFYVQMVHGYHGEELFLMVYGKAGSGKSTALQIPMLIFGPRLTASTPLVKLGTPFGLTMCYDKRTNVNADLAVRTLNTDTHAILKMLTGGSQGSDGQIEVQFKYKDAFAYPIQCYFMFGANQLMRLGEDLGLEIESLMRRVCLVHYTKQSVPCEEFKQLLADPEFLDALYYILMHMPVEKIRLPTLPEYINQNFREWMQDADPISNFVNETFRYAKGSKLDVAMVHTTIRDALYEEDIPIPVHFANSIRLAMNSIHVDREMVDGQAMYMGLAFKDTIRQAKYLSNQTTEYLQRVQKRVMEKANRDLVQTSAHMMAIKQAAENQEESAAEPGPMWMRKPAGEKTTTIDRLLKTVKQKHQ